VIPLTIDELAELSLGDLTPVPRATLVTGVKVDSRLVAPGELFVAVGAGKGFLDDARGRGAAATLVPDDAFGALASLGAAVRDRSGARVVGITGSTGKTSTKDILAALCRPHARTVAAESSFNNEIGLPLTLCRLESDTEICILELAMRGFGQIAELAAVARPQIGAITNIGPVHLELVDSLEGVARAKAELLAALPAGGTAIVPAGAELDAYLEVEGVEVVRVGAGGDVRLTGVESGERTTTVAAELAGERVEVEFNFTAQHQVDNALVALAAYRALGLPLAKVGVGAGEIVFSRWRGEEVQLPGGGLLINDSYNANPVSMRAALRTLAVRAGSRRRVAILGDMAELGPSGPAYHREIGAEAAEVGLHALVAIGTLARGYLDGAAGVEQTAWAPTLEEGLDAATRIVEPGDCVLVKGSRAMGLEAVAEALAAEVVTP
jgi:UDP-N-acetylmuramoyl-tripeptide--D-alanyl-D-alanine ligase